MTRRRVDLHYPPRDWFDRPADSWFSASQRLNIDGNGRVTARLHNLNLPTPNRGGWVPPNTTTDFAAFHGGSIPCSDGSRIAVGPVGLGHEAPDVLSPARRAGFYTDPARVRAHVRVGQDDQGVWAAGALVPGLKDRDIDVMRGCVLSGDWVPMPADWWLVNGARTAAAAQTAARTQLELLAIGIVPVGACATPAVSVEAARTTAAAEEWASARARLAALVAEDARTAVIAEVRAAVAELTSALQDAWGRPGRAEVARIAAAGRPHPADRLRRREANTAFRIVMATKTLARKTARLEHADHEAAR